MKRVLLLFLIACGGGGGSSDGSGDDTPTADSGIDTPPVQQMITISGTATSREVLGAMPVQGAVIAAYQRADENTALATAMTDAQGNFSLTITSNGQALDGFLKATKTGFVPSFLYPPAPVADGLMMVPMNMLTTQNFMTLSTLAQGNQTDGNGLIALIVVSGPMPTSPPVAGATITTTPGSNPYRYNANGLPSSSATSTAADGIAYAFNAPPGDITANAMKTGSTFKATSLKAHPDALTQTLVTP